MTAKQLYRHCLTEMTKVNAPAIPLHDFNYFINKAVNQYINKRYNIYDINQQTSDDLRVLKATAFLPAVKWDQSGYKETKVDGAADGDSKRLAELKAGASRYYGATYEVQLPLDYMHMLNCVCVYDVNERWECYDKGDNFMQPATRLTADLWAQIMNNPFLRPDPFQPYYYIHNINQYAELPTNPMVYDGNDNNKLQQVTDIHGTDSTSNYPADVLDVANDPKINTHEDAPGILPRTIQFRANTIANSSLVEREAGVRYGNASNVRCEIRYGGDDTLFTLIGVAVDYIKAPQFIRLTQAQVNITRDTSQVLEFPDYVCQEIVNELVMILLENTANPRIQTQPTVSQSIANPAAQQQAPQQQQHTQNRQ